MNRELIAQVAHEVNRAYCLSLGDASVPAWADAPEAQRASILAGVDMHLANPDATPEEAHQSWLEQKAAEGWVYGEVKDAEKKEHPCFKPYEELPPEQRAKDYVFRGVVHALAALPVEQVPPVRGNLKAAAVDMQAVPPVGVKYIGRRDPHSDTLYASGLWTKDQVKAVTAPLARQLLKHADVFVEVPLAEAGGPLVLERKSGETSDERTQELRDLVQNMDKAALKDLAQQQFRTKIDGRLSLADTRAQVIQLIDQYGA